VGPKNSTRFYSTTLFNDHWGEQAHVNTDNSLSISMVSHGLDTEQARKSWQPFLDWIARPPADYKLKAAPIVADQKLPTPDGRLSANHFRMAVFRCPR
jgi:hypothetical protein